MKLIIGYIHEFHVKRLLGYITTQVALMIDGPIAVEDMHGCGLNGGGECLKGEN